MYKYIARIGSHCVACGVCMKSCPRQAITVVNGIKAKVDENMCVGCGICTKTCPAGIIEKVERSLYESKETLV